MGTSYHPHVYPLLPISKMQKILFLVPYVLNKLNYVILAHIVWYLNTYYFKKVIEDIITDQYMTQTHLIFEL